MLHSTSLLHHNHHRFLFSFRSKPSLLDSHSQSQPLSFSKSLSLPSSSSSSSSTCCHVTRISTEPLELSPPPPGFNFRREITRLTSLRDKLAACDTLDQKLRIINADYRVRRFFGSSSRNAGLARVLSTLRLDSENLFLLKCLVAAGQEHVLCSGETMPEMESSVMASGSVKSAFYALAKMIEKMDSGNGNSGGGFGMGLEDHEIRELNKLLETLAQVERFYDCIGGVIGYQIMVLELIVQQLVDRKNTNWSQHMHEVKEGQILGIDAPTGLDLSESTEYASQAALWGIEGLPDLGEIYPLGGSADRLDLVDPSTGECLPAAMLPFCGRTLLEGLIRDLQAREFLYFKLYGKQCITPVAIMTSSAKNNHKHITSLCETLSWFGRGRSTFQLFEQPLVPVVGAEDGQWLVTKPFSPLSKPGGHGVIWKLAHDKGIFKWFFCQGRKGATVRQVSNVVAATDVTLLALAGIGLRQGKVEVLIDNSFFSITVPSSFDHGGVVVYYTSLRVIRRTFNDCRTVRSILKRFSTAVDERDVCVDERFREELQQILGRRNVPLPCVFIGGEYIGGVDDLKKIYDSGELQEMIERLPKTLPNVCDFCGSMRFVVCDECNGSHRVFVEKSGFKTCLTCNSNGLIRCPACFFDLPRHTK